jgi:hypothetical protein
VKGERWRERGGGRGVEGVRWRERGRGRGREGEREGWTEEEREIESHGGIDRLKRET